jgi:hypothetical protein
LKLQDGSVVDLRDESELLEYAQALRHEGGVYRKGKESSALTHTVDVLEALVENLQSSDSGS